MENYGKEDYHQASSILVLADGGGSNSSRHYIFKEDIQKLANEIGIEIRMAHCPPYTSKYNPIEHRLFCHIKSAFLLASVNEFYAQLRILSIAIFQHNS